MGYIFIAGTILFTVYGQIILKWRIARYGMLPEEILPKIKFLISLLFDPFIFSGFISAFVASLFWMAAMTKFHISFAYPFMSTSFILVLLLSVIVLGETLTIGKILGLAFIVSGIIITVKL
jgi:drug/metabolite transporter (DMT)-like permease